MSRQGANFSKILTIDQQLQHKPPNIAAEPLPDIDDRYALAAVRTFENPQITISPVPSFKSNLGN